MDFLPVFSYNIVVLPVKKEVGIQTFSYDPLLPFFGFPLNKDSRRGWGIGTVGVTQVFSPELISRFFPIGLLFYGSGIFFKNVV